MQTRSRDLGRNRACGEQTFSGLPLAGPLLFPAPRGHLPPKFGLEGGLRPHSRSDCRVFATVCSFSLCTVCFIVGNRRLQLQGLRIAILYGLGRCIGEVWAHLVATPRFWQARSQVRDIQTGVATKNVRLSNAGAAEAKDTKPITTPFPTRIGKLFSQKEIL